MKRTSTDTEGKTLWHKTGGGSLRLANGKIIKPNQRFWAYPHEISENFKDIIVPVGGADPKTGNEPVPTFKMKPVEDPEKSDDGTVKSTGKEINGPQYEMKARGHGGWYDVLQIGSDKKMNEKALREDEAVKMLKSLNG